MDTRVERAGEGPAPDFEEAREALDSLASAEPLCRAGHAELTEALELLGRDDVRGAIARLQLAQGRAPDPVLLEAAAEAILSEATDDDRRWMEDPDAVVELVFERADQPDADAFWLGRSALLAAQEYPRQYDDETILEFVRSAIAKRDIPRTRALEVAVLLTLERDDEAEKALRSAIKRYTDRPLQLLELLEAAQADAELPELADRGYATVSSQRPDLREAIEEARAKDTPEAGDENTGLRAFLGGWFSAAMTGAKVVGLDDLPRPIHGNPSPSSPWAKLTQPAASNATAWMAFAAFVVLVTVLLLSARG